MFVSTCVHARARRRDEPVRAHNSRGRISFAKTSFKNSRTTQLFINLNNNSRLLDHQGFAPFAHVLSGMETVDKIYAGCVPWSLPPSLPPSLLRSHVISLSLSPSLFSLSLCE
eukprot:COSAG01_NODE_4667_length_4834_cov_23.607814_6_plen_113_part_00